MNDQQLDALVADTARDVHRIDAGRLRAAELALLEEIVTTRPRRRPAVALGVVGVAAAVAALVALPALVAGGRDRPALPAAGSPTRTASPTPTSASGPTAAAVRSVADSPRIQLQADGWSLQDLGSDGVGYRAGRRSLEITWYPAASYESYRKDRADVSAVQILPVLGVNGRMVTYERGDYAIMLPPAHGSFVELRAQGLADERDFRDLLGRLHQVDALTWLNDLPPDILVPRTDGSTTTAVLADVPLPPGVTAADVTPDAPADYYQYGAHVAGVVACGWLASWTDAVERGDAAARDRAVAAMGTSRQWPVLKRMASEGDYPQTVWAYAADIAAGRQPEGYVGGLGCGS